MKVCKAVANTLLLVLTLALPTISPPAFNPTDFEIGPFQLDVSNNDLLAPQRPHPRRLLQNPRTPPTPLQTRSIMLNAVDYLDNEWIGWYTSITSFLPIPFASAGLARLYDQVYSASLLTWVGDEPERNLLTMTMGFLQLQIRGEAGAAIPWVFESSFAEQLRMATRMGFCGGYTAFYSNPTRGVGVVVTLTTMAMVAAAA